MSNDTNQNNRHIDERNDKQRHTHNTGCKPESEKTTTPLSHRDAEAAAPEDNSVCGEEDPGSALESLMDPDK